MPTAPLRTACCCNTAAQIQLALIPLLLHFLLLPSLLLDSLFVHSLLLHSLLTKSNRKISAPQTLQAGCCSRH